MPRAAASPASASASATAALAARFAERQSHLSERRRELVQAMLDASDETYHLSSRELAKRYDVDTATIVRTIQALGYERFADFAADLRRHFVARITPYARMRDAARKRSTVADEVHRCLEVDADNINVLRTTADAERMIAFARRVHRSRRILVVGLDFAASLAWALAYGLVRLGFDAEAPIGGSGHVEHKVRVLAARDMLVAISFGQCLRETVDAARLAHAQGVPTFGLTDGAATPLAHAVDDVVVAPTASSSYLASYVAPLAAIDAMLVACAHLDPKRSLARLRRADADRGPSSRWAQDVKPRGGARR